MVPWLVAQPVPTVKTSSPGDLSLVWTGSSCATGLQEAHFYLGHTGAALKALCLTVVTEDAAGIQSLRFTSSPAG